MEIDLTEGEKMVSVRETKKRTSLVARIEVVKGSRGKG